MNDPTKPQSRKLVTQKAGPLDTRRRPGGLTKRVKIAIDALMFDRCTREQACEKAGFTERALYLALAKPEVAIYWNAQLHVLRTGERAQNIHRLADIRDRTGGNAMAAVAAVKALEQLSEAAPPPVTREFQPGICIVVLPRPADTSNRAPSKMIELSPDAGPRDTPSEGHGE